MSDMKFSQLPEVLESNGNELIPILVNGENKIIRAKVITGSKTTTHIDLDGDDGNRYRAKIKNGKISVYPFEVDTADDATYNALYDGLIINKMYGGGSALVETPVSHSFIELYNFRDNALNLKGVYLWYRAKAGSWQSLALKGIVPPKHSFLIRCGEHNDLYADSVRCAIDDYDMEWEIKLSDQGFSAYLSIGNATPEDNPLRFTTDELGNIDWTNPKYIDLLGAGGSEEGQNVWAYETRHLNCMNRNTAVHRVDFANSGAFNVGSNALLKKTNDSDCEPIDFLSCDVNLYRPRSLSDGRWNEFYDKTKQREYVPNMINLGFGEDGDTTRTLTFHTVISDEGYVRYKKLQASDWQVVDTTRNIVRNKDGDSTVHHAVINELEIGIYEYQVGFEGCWSDISTFEIKVFNADAPMRVLWTTDQQSWTKREYKVWGTIAKYLRQNKAPLFDWHLNTGDISQNANRTFEWRDYFRYGNELTRDMPHMITCGNNDLVSKRFSDTFATYVTHENQFANSVHAWDLGYAHFVCLNSNSDSTYVDGVGNIGGYDSTDAFLEAQATWLDEHLTAVNARATKPRWVIVYAHLSPFTVGRTIRLQRWVAVFEKHKIDLVLCGHNHAYSRSRALKTGYDFNKSAPYNDYVKKVVGTTDLLIVDEFKADGTTPIDRAENIAEGTVYILNQAAGFKLSGKENPILLPEAQKGTIHDNGAGQPWWINYQALPTNPVYVDLQIKYDSIVMNAYQLENIISYDAFKNTLINEDISKITEASFDTLIINYVDRVK